MASTQLAIRQDQGMELLPDLDKALSQAKVLIRSGLIPKGYDTPEKVVTVMLKGRELGLGPMVALQHLFPTGQGNVGMDGQVVQVLISRAGHTFEVLERSEERCRIMLYPKGGKPYPCEVTMAEAVKAGWNMEPNYVLNEKTGKRDKQGMREKHTWKSQPATMLFWRCLAKGARQGMAACLNDGLELMDGYEVVQTRQGLEADRTANIERDRALLVENRESRPGLAPLDGQPRGRLWASGATEPVQHGGQLPQPIEGECREAGTEEAAADPDPGPTDRPETTDAPTPAPWGKWSEGAKKAFWAALTGLGIDDDAVHAEFGVSSMTEYAGGQPRAATLVRILKYGLGKTLSLAQVHEALNVAIIAQWAGSFEDAKEAIDSWMAMAIEFASEEEAV